MTEPAPAPKQQAAPAAAAPKAATGPLSAAEQQQLAALQSRQDQAAVDAGEAVRMKVEGSHASITYGGLTVTTEPTTVPASMAAALTEAAADAGVTITQES